MKKHLILTAIILACCLFSEATAASKPNILLILVDDMGYSDLGCFGGEIDTPNIDRLAEQGIRFTEFSNCAKCETSRTTLMTGRFHVEEGVYQGKTAITIPENLALAGYQNFALGKWHIFSTPMKRGFDRYFGFLEGATNFLTGEGTQGSYSYRLDDKVFNDFPKDFYSSNAFTDYGIQFIKERDRNKPFFMYMAYNAPHYPLQAPKAEVMKYRGKYKDGWQKVRDTRFARLKELGIIDENAEMSEKEKEIKGWKNLSDKERDNMDLRMATYAAMIDIVDQKVGRLVETLKSEKIYQDTLIIFLSDNGACPFDRTRKPTKDNNYMPWDGRSYWCYPEPWAKACNTPFQGHKQSQFEGGIATPMIAHWPKGITVPGSFNRQRGHLVDFHATFRELAGVDYPSLYDYKTKQLSGQKIGPARGISLVPAFSGKKRTEHEYLYQNFSNGKTALVRGDWKLVNYKKLYNLKSDRIESEELSQSMPEKFEQMKSEFARLDVKLNDGKALEKTEVGKKSLISNWLVRGPYKDTSIKGTESFQTALGSSSGEKWKPLKSELNRGMYSLEKQLGTSKQQCAYLKTTLVVPNTTEAVIELSAKEKIIAMLNGEVLDDRQSKVNLKAGENELIVKVVGKNSKWWAFSCRVKKDYLPVPGLSSVAK
jgi:arylsulfatase